MRKVILLIIGVLSVYYADAQGKRIIKDSFENNRFQWEEFYEKKSSASVQDGYLELENDDDNTSAWSVVEFPINVDKNFDLSYDFNAEVTDDYWFGIIFNYEDAGNFSCFIVQEKRFRLINTVNGVSSISRRNDIILKKARNKDVKISMKKKGRKLNFNVDGMDVITITKEMTSNVFGCIIVGENSIKLKEVIIEQMSED